MHRNSTDVPMWRGVLCIQGIGNHVPFNLDSGLWSVMMKLHGSSGLSTAGPKIKFDLFCDKVQPTMVELQISILRWVQPPYTLPNSDQFGRPEYLDCYHVHVN